MKTGKLLFTIYICCHATDIRTTTSPILTLSKKAKKKVPRKSKNDHDHEMKLDYCSILKQERNAVNDELKPRFQV